MQLFFRTGVLIVLITFSAFAEDAAAPKRNSKVYNYFSEAAAATTPQLAWSAKTPEEHAAWRTAFYAKLKELLGRTPPQVPLAVDWEEEKDFPTFTRHKIYIQSEAAYWIPAYYYVPKNLTEPAPAIICLHGHSGIMPYIGEGTRQEQEKSKDHALDYAVHFAKAGYISLALVQRGWNETHHPDNSHSSHSCHRVTMDAFLLGMTPVGLRTWDASRALDFLETQEEVDSTRIGAAGLSGGGTTTLFFAAIEPRVKLALVAGYFCTFRDSIFEIHHCICNCVPHIMEWGEMSDVGALIAPRPLLVISGDKDSIFPIDATRRAFDRLKQTYGVLKAEDKLESDFFEGVHEWSNRKSLPFLEKHFK